LVVGAEANEAPSKERICSGKELRVGAILLTTAADGTAGERV
jgi:hypothetical protein